MTARPAPGTAAPSTAPGDRTEEGAGAQSLPPERFAAVVNDEGQYSLWPTWQPLPDGWHDTGVHGSREKCLSHIETVWTDMRPRSLKAPQEPQS